VRETASQTLASLLLHMPKRSVLRVHTVFLSMIRQDFVAPKKPSSKPTGRRGSKKKQQKQERTDLWEVRHVGLLGIKYEMAVRSDLFDDEDAEVKVENGDVKMEDTDLRLTGTSGSEMDGKQILQDVVDSALLG
jgi:TATA-binding protein-associated factor